MMTSVLFFFAENCFGYLEFFVVPNKFQDFVSISVKNFTGCFDKDYTKSIDCCE
jgi:hypothetical protein